jgi:hypothetical protein
MNRRIIRGSSGLLTRQRRALLALAALVLYVAAGVGAVYVAGAGVSNADVGSIDTVALVGSVEAAASLPALVDHDRIAVDEVVVYSVPMPMLLVDSIDRYSCKWHGWGGQCWYAAYLATVSFWGRALLLTVVGECFSAGKPYAYPCCR